MEENNNVQTTNVEPEKKGNGSKIIICILIVLVLCAGGYFAYTKFILKDDTNKTNNTEVPKDENGNYIDEKIEPEVIDYSNANLVGGYKALSGTSDGKEIYKYLIIRSGGIYTFGNDNQNLIERSVGEYQLNGDKLSFYDMVYYGKDNCYYISGDLVGFRMGTIKDENTIVIETYDGKELTFIKDSSVVESEKDYNWYVLEPKNGTTPNGFDKAWTDCTNDQKK